ncbi:MULTISPECIES: heavy metal-binding domain-containing protein [Asticcacaulis]|jgi:uncharacterized protein YbjQ (UPF0145 family)|uniref:UPF0145 protein GCM10011273_21120 n=1 Tax=Asticcacaulis endophyticus TaxID=1395890 RepID=A0A918UTP1_9CAUL|nr:UPF0145 protein [Asticcacaulis endophyticus]
MSEGIILTTTNTVEGRPVEAYLGIVTGEAILGANIFRDLFAGIRDIIGGRSGSYEKVLRQARDAALKEMQIEAEKLGGTAILSVDIDYQTVGQGTMLMVSCSGTAVRLR